MRLSDDEARARFGASRVARLATTGTDGRPHLVPVTFALHGDTVATAVDRKPKSTPDLQRLRNIRARPSVCLLADHYAEDWSGLWWVRADGQATILTDPGDCAVPLGWLAARYQQYQAQPPAGPVILVTVSHWAGWLAAPDAGPEVTALQVSDRGDHLTADDLQRSDIPDIGDGADRRLESHLR